MVSHQAASEAARPRQGHVLDTSTSRPAPARTARALRPRRGGTGPGRPGPVAPSGQARARPPGGGHPVVRLRACPHGHRGAAAGAKDAGDLCRGAFHVRHEHSPQRQRMPSKEASSNVSAAASSTAKAEAVDIRAPRHADELCRPSPERRPSRAAAHRAAAARAPGTPCRRGRRRARGSSRPAWASSSSTSRSETASGRPDEPRRRSQPAATERQASMFSSRTPSGSPPPGTAGSRARRTRRASPPARAS